MAESDDDEDENVVRRHIWQRCGGGRSFWRILGWVTIYKGVKATLHANHRRSWAAFVRLACRQLAEMAHADSLADMETDVTRHDIVSAAATFKRTYVERWVSPSAIGDIRMGDEQPRVQPPPPPIECGPPGRTASGASAAAAARQDDRRPPHDGDRGPWSRLALHVAPWPLASSSPPLSSWIFEELGPGACPVHDHRRL